MTGLQTLWLYCLEKTPKGYIEVRSVVNPMGEESRTIDSLAEGAVTLIVADLKRWKAIGKVLPQIEGMFFVDIDSLHRPILEAIQPTVVLAPLVSQSFDAFDVAAQLQSLGFRGRLRVLADDVPDPKMIQQEIAALAPDLDFAVLNLPFIKLRGI